MRTIPLAWLLICACGRSGFDFVDDSASDGDVGGDGASDGPALAYEAVFTQIAATSPPSVRRASGAAEETGGSRRIWIFGGYGPGGTILGDTHAFTPATSSWAMFATTGSPGTRERHALAWDPVGNALVQFGGQNRPVINYVHYDTLAVLDPQTVSWTTIPKAGTWPAARKDAALVWLPHLSKFLMYGGNDGSAASNRFDELWLLTLDASAGTATWSALTPGGVTAPAQSAACVAYDPTGRRLVIYGGETQDGVDVNTTYQYLVDTNVWQLDATTGTTPGGESFSHCAWDPTSARLVLFGGQRDGGAPEGGAFTYNPDAQQWASPPLRTATPVALSDGGAVYSEALGSVLMFGGRSGTTTYRNDTWSFDIQ